MCISVWMCIQSLLSLYMYSKLISGGRFLSVFVSKITEVVINDDFLLTHMTMSVQLLQQTADASQKRYQTPARDSLMQPHLADMTARKGPLLKGACLSSPASLELKNACFFLANSTCIIASVLPVRLTSQLLPGFVAKT